MVILSGLECGCQNLLLKQTEICQEMHKNLFGLETICWRIWTARKAIHFEALSLSELLLSLIHKMWGGMKVYTEIHPGVRVCGIYGSIAAKLWFQNPMSCNLNLFAILKCFCIYLCCLSMKRFCNDTAIFSIHWLTSFV
ncbi:hypothetical protein PAHAL_6G078300 [Panicum hallii]|uniref:Uncharacterized protein n=1 Tax=Panicum hallii TaxID=206008 RepID=A0A2S3I150_9POAL|nr:hypothetical protein PAHAL_6G078300 [Panicum hallii]